MDDAIKLRKSIRTSDDQTNFSKLAVDVVKKNLQSLVDIYNKNVTGLTLKTFASTNQSMK